MEGGVRIAGRRRHGACVRAPAGAGTAVAIEGARVEETPTVTQLAGDATVDVDVQDPLPSSLLDLSPTASARERAKAARPQFVPGSRIGKYEVRHVLGRGGQACAYLAFDPDLERHVVLKLYHGARSARAISEVLKEGRALARISSPYVAQCYGAEHHEGMPYLVLEYVPGRTLVELLASGRPKLARALEIVDQVADGLAAVHRCGMLHRDIKSSNIIVGDDGIPRLVDFGLAEPVRGERSERISGTLAYMSPEQARGEAEMVGPATDVFGVGSVLYELLTGRPPYQGSDESSLLKLARTGDVQPLGEIEPGLPAPVVELCMRCLASRPEDRFATAGELRDALRTCLRRHARASRGFSFGFRLGKRRFQLQLATFLSVLVAGASLSLRVGPPDASPGAPGHGGMALEIHAHRSPVAGRGEPSVPVYAPAGPWDSASAFSRPALLFAGYRAMPGTPHVLPGAPPAPPGSGDLAQLIREGGSGASEPPGCCSGLVFSP